MVLVARDVRGPWPGHVQRDTTSDGMLAFGHSRSGSSRSPCRAHASGVEIGRNDWAAPEPVTGWNVRFVNSAARVPACLAGSRGFDSRTRRQISLPR